MPTIEMMWKGEKITTLPDYLRPGLKAVFVGINPAVKSVNAGHYYQGQLGKRFWKRLMEFGIVDHLKPGKEDESLFAAGFGLTDIVKKPTSSAKELDKADFDHGLRLLVEKQQKAKPGLVCFTFATAADAAESRLERAGLTTCRMPGPYARRDIVEEEMSELANKLNSIR